MNKQHVLYTIIGVFLILFSCNDGKNSDSSAESRTIKVVNGGVPISLDAIDKSYYAKARQNFVMIYSGTSHSTQINDGVAELSGRESWTAWTFLEGRYGLEGDLGNPDYTTWESRTRSYLTDNPAVNIVMWSWCGQVGDASVDQSGRYLDLMEGLIRDYPNVTFVFMTGHADGKGLNGAVNIANEKIRKHCQENNRWLFDFADFDATNPAGISYLDKNVNANTDYDDGNWAEEWFNNYPDDYHSCNCEHSEEGYESLNCNRKAIGFVHMMARMAGWDGK